MTALATAAPLELRLGYRSAREVVRAHARSFWFASHALFGARRRGAFALYAFCRRLDDLVDGTSDARLLPHRLVAARAAVASVFRGTAGVDERLWPAPEWLAFRDTVQRFELPEQPFQELISGMEMDLLQRRYASWSELALYCHRVAGTVGWMMAPLLGCRDADAQQAAADLGKAMQLTNILRDVREDLERGRIYLPQDELGAFGVSEHDLRAGRVDQRWRELARFQIARARGLYAQGARGIPALRGFGAQAMVRVMSAVYGGILDEIERADFDVFSRRASVSGGGKLVLAARALVGAAP